MPELAGVEHEWVTARGARFHVAVAGPADGPVVVLLHGWPQHWWMWRDAIGPLATAGLRVLAPDLRGYGWSEVTPGGYRTDERAADVLAVLDALGIRDFAIAGHDWGGAAAVTIALAHPERVERLLGLNTVHPFVPRDLRTLRASLAGFWYMPLLAAPVLGPWIARSPRLLARTMGREARGGWGERERALYFDRLDPHATRRTYAAFGSGTGDRTARLRPPTLWLHGAKDPAIRPEHLRGLREHADDVRIELMPELGHFCLEQDPATVVPRIVAFLAPGRSQANSQAS
ncbi:MAG: alpha/beta fold hydrolase [Solirubrobacteraceae bacterium]